MISYHESDALAAKYFNNQDFVKALEQNKITESILQNKEPYIFKNNAACYSRLLEPLLALDNFKQYMTLSGSQTIEDLRLLSDYYAQAGLLDEAMNVITSKQHTSFEKYHDLSIHMFKHKHYSHGFRLLRKAKLLGNVLWIGEKKWNNLPDCPRWNGESIYNKHVCLIGECGLGDEIIFSRWIPNILSVAASVSYLTDNTLIDVFTRNFSGLKKHDNKNNYDLWIPTMDLPVLLNIINIQSTSYISPNQSYVNKWRKKLPEQFYTINWTGSKNYSQNHFRDIPIDYLLTKINKPTVNICLETDYNPKKVIDIRKDINCWEDTLAILYLSDRLYTSCSSVSHAAGSMGKSVYVYTRPDDYFIWNSTSSGGFCEWYENVRVWRTKTIGKWNTVIDKSF